MNNKPISDITLLVPELQETAKKVNMDITIHNFPFKIFETKRLVIRQEELFKQGYTKTMQSAHIIGCAFDLVLFINGQFSWEYKKYNYWWESIIRFISLKYGLEAGGLWSTFKDYPHYQIKNFKEKYAK